MCGGIVIKLVYDPRKPLLRNQRDRIGQQGVDERLAAKRNGVLKDMPPPIQPLPEL